MQALWISCLFGICLVPLGVSAKECYECVPGTSQSDLFCNKPVNKTSCNDDCLTVSYKVKNDLIELSGNLMTCGMGACEAAAKAGCEDAKKTPPPGFNVTDCQHKCCSGDLCNDKSLYAGDVSTPTAPTTTGSSGTTGGETSPRSHYTPTSSGGRGVARFGAIFAAFLLSCFQI